MGSGCVDSVCPQALSRNDDACRVTSGVAEIAFTAPPNESEDFYLCLPAPLRRSDGGTVQARVLYNGPVECTERPYLKPASGSELCELNQLAVIDADAGEPIVSAGDGFYYDDFSALIDEECVDAVAALVVTAGAKPWEAESVAFATIETRAGDGSEDDDLTCAPLRGSEPVGTACLPDEQRYFDDSQSVLETRADACGDGLCLAYHLGGDTDPSCEEGAPGEPGVSRPVCATPQDIEARAYCTCRCDGPAGSSDLCECPSGFSCVDVVELREDVAGSYCVRNGELAE